MIFSHGFARLICFLSQRCAMNFWQHNMTEILETTKCEMLPFWLPTDSMTLFIVANVCDSEENLENPAILIGNACNKNYNVAKMYSMLNRDNPQQQSYFHFIAGWKPTSSEWWDDCRFLWCQGIPAASPLFKRPMRLWIHWAAKPQSIKLVMIFMAQCYLQFTDCCTVRVPVGGVILL